MSFLVNLIHIFSALILSPVATKGFKFNVSVLIFLFKFSIKRNTKRSNNLPKISDYQTKTWNHLILKLNIPSKSNLKD